MHDDDFLQSFEDCTLPFGQWTHRSHVKVAYLYLRRFPFDQALDKVRTGIQNYNAAHQVPEGPASGYNETTTQAFLWLVAATMQAYGETLNTPSSDAFCDTHAQLMTKDALRFFYSPAARKHPLAKKQFVEPDLAPLPKRTTE
ncbi:MAG: hypothetical protein AB7O62_25875 [Pirellulales bacterium]